jgi:hypothetical protein
MDLTVNDESQARAFQTAWQLDQSANNDAFHARSIDGDGTLAGVHLIDDTTAPEREPDVTSNQSGCQYLLAWQTMYARAKCGIWGPLPYSDETMDAGFGIVQLGSATDRTNAVVAGGSTSYPAAW